MFGGTGVDPRISSGGASLEGAASVAAGGAVCVSATAGVDAGVSAGTVSCMGWATTGGAAIIAAAAIAIGERKDFICTARSPPSVAQWR